MRGSQPQNRVETLHPDIPPDPELLSSPTAGLILAGGLGRRFGGPKAFAHLPDGRTFLEACAEVMLQGGLAPLAATLPPEVKGTIPPSVQPLQLPKSDLDMFASIKIGLQHLVKDLSWHRLILLPVDHPLINAATITALATPNYPAAIPSLHGRHGHPIMISRPIAEAIAGGRLPGPTLREILLTAPAQDVPVDDNGIRANCNTPETLQKAWDALHE